MVFRVRHFAVLLILLLAAPAQAKPADIAFMRGMTISCPMNGKIWGSSAMRTAILEVKKLGVDSVSIHPYARIARNGAIRFTPAAKTDYLVRAVKIAKETGMPLFWKPHLAYWGSFQWRGAIDFGNDEASWRRFFSSYEAWIVDHARFAAKAGVPVFAVGVELDGTAHRQREWRHIISEVRKVYHGRITYAANWDTYPTVPFWDAVDMVGVQAYFPVGHDVNPSASEVARYWDTHLSALQKISRASKRPILFTEIGYTRSDKAATKPWDPAVNNTEHTRALRRKLMEVALDKIATAPHVKGVYWWKWIPGWAPWERDFSMRDDEAQGVLRDRWTRKR